MAASVVHDVYYVSLGCRLLRIPDEKNVFRAASGNVYKSLSVRRIEVLEGLEVLRQAETEPKSG